MIGNISESERFVMRVLWKKSPLMLNEIVNELKDYDWSTNTIQTFLGRLVKKGAVMAQRQGKGFQYTSIVDEKDYLEAETQNFIERLYGGSIESMMLGFVKSGKLSAKEIENLKKIIEEGE